MKKPLAAIAGGAALELSAEAVSFGAALTTAMTTNDHSAEQIRSEETIYLIHLSAKSSNGKYSLLVTCSVG